MSGASEPLPKCFSDFVKFRRFDRNASRGSLLVLRTGFGGFPVLQIGGRIKIAESFWQRLSKPEEG